MPKLTQKLPKYRLHVASGQAVVSLGGLQFYLGPYDAPATREKYNRLMGDWIASGRQLPGQAEGPAAGRSLGKLVEPGATGQESPPPAADGRGVRSVAGAAPAGQADTVSAGAAWPAGQPIPQGLLIVELFRDYARHAETYYVKDGRQTSEVGSIKGAMKPATRLFGHAPAAAFDAPALERVREEMIAAGLSRRSCNRNVGRLKAIFKWGVRKKLVPAAVLAELQTVDGLRRGRSKARETERVRPVAYDLVEAVKPHVAAPVWAMIQLQWWAAMRSGEVCIMRGRDVDMAGGEVWLYTPASHKTEHHDLARVVDLGPRAQDVLRPFLKGDPEAYLFQPAEAVKTARQRQREDRKPGGVGNHKRRAKAPRRAAGERYTSDSYRRAIARGCALAFPPEGELARRDGETRKQWKARLTPEQRKELAAWRKAHHWHPHQLRHSAATRVRKEAGIDAARAVLGHHSIPMAEHYAEQDRELVRAIAKRIG